MFRGGALELSDTIAVSIIAALLSLLPVVVLLWIYYVRERQPTVRGPVMARFFGLGMLSVGVAIVLERSVYEGWRVLFPETSRLFFSEGGDYTTVPALLGAIVVSLGVVAFIEEAIRYVCMRVAVDADAEFDQLIDAVQYGFALGLGFAFVENTLYFIQLFQRLDFDTLVVVFFLRFLISTVGHLSFGGIMGYYLGLARVFPAERRVFLRRAFVIPWLMHGLFDTLLTVQLSFYTVLLLVIPLFLFWAWFQDARMVEFHVLRGKRLRFPVAFRRRPVAPRRPSVVEVLPNMTSCPNCYLSLGGQEGQCLSCGLRLHRRGLPAVLPFLKRET